MDDDKVERHNAATVYIGAQMRWPGVTAWLAPTCLSQTTRHPRLDSHACTLIVVACARLWHERALRAHHVHLIPVAMDTAPPEACRDLSSMDTRVSALVVDAIDAGNHVHSLAMVGRGRGMRNFTMPEAVRAMGLRMAEMDFVEVRQPMSMALHAVLQHVLGMWNERYRRYQIEAGAPQPRRSARLAAGASTALYGQWTTLRSRPSDFALYMSVIAYRRCCLIVYEPQTGELVGVDTHPRNHDGHGAIVARSPDAAVFAQWFTRNLFPEAWPVGPNRRWAARDHKFEVSLLEPCSAASTEALRRRFGDALPEPLKYGKIFAGPTPFSAAQGARLAASLHMPTPTPMDED